MTRKGELRKACREVVTAAKLSQARRLAELDRALGCIAASRVSRGLPAETPRASLPDSLVGGSPAVISGPGGATVVPLRRPNVLDGI